MTTKLYREIAVSVDAWKRCKASGNKEFEMRWDDRLNACEDLLPSGSGFDCGTKIDRDRSSGNKLVLTTSYHHMHESGMYDGWTEHAVSVTPSFSGIDLMINGSNRNGFKEYAYDVFQQCLEETIEVSADNSVNVVSQWPC